MLIYLQREHLGSNLDMTIFIMSVMAFSFIRDRDFQVGVDYGQIRIGVLTCYN